MRAAAADGTTPPMTTIQDISTPALVTETSIEGGALAVRAVGTADGGTVEDLTAYLAHLDCLAREQNAEEIILDLRDVEFLSASCMRVLVEWLGEVARGRGRGARFVLDARKPWLLRSFETLAALDGGHVRIDSR